jgi:hypothetical protein
VTAAEPTPVADPHWPPPSRYGERSVAIANDRKGVVRRSVESLADMPADLPRAALVGGLAVMVRLYESHRVTTDFDEVTDARDTMIDLLLARGAVRTANGVSLPEFGVQLDLIDAAMTLKELAAIAEAAAAHPLTDLERSALQLALVCRYALETATATQILVVEGEQVVAEVALPVALAGSLVAMKVHAAVQPTRRPDKAAGDIYDAYRLVRAWGPTVIADDLSHAPIVMLREVVQQVTDLYVDGAERSARRLRAASMPGVQAVDAEDLEGLGELVGAIEPFLEWDAQMAPAEGPERQEEGT